MNTKFLFFGAIALLLLYSCSKDEEGIPSSSVTDIDGNVYKTITLGNQTWMAENLRTTHYNDGSPIYNELDDENWAYPNSGAYCSFNNTTDQSIIKKYGLLYNWYATSSASNGGKNICPKGWHIPTDAEWKELITYLFNHGYGSTDSTWKEVGKSLASTTEWNYSTLSLAVGHNQEQNNKSGFNAYPVPPRTSYFNVIGLETDFWSSTERNNIEVVYYQLVHDGRNLLPGYRSKFDGLCIRCIRDK